MEDADRDDRLSSVLEGVLTRFQAMVRSVAVRHRLDPSDLDDVAQDVRIRLWQASRRGEPIEKLGTSYVYRVAKTAALDLLRRRARSERRDEPIDADRPPLAASGRGPATRVEEDELTARIGAVVETLALPRRTAVRLHLAGYDREEISRMLGWSEAKTRNLLYRGLADLRGALRELGIGPEGIE